MTRLFFTMMPQSGNVNLKYHNGSISVVATLDKKQKVGDTYIFCLYDSQLRLIDYAETGSPSVERSGRSLKAVFHNESVWIPGQYMLLMRWANGLIRFDLQLSDSFAIKCITQRHCSRLSDEDILSGRLEAHRLWGAFSRKPGMGQLKQWLIRRGKQNELNQERQHVDPVEPCHNLLLTSATEGSLTLQVNLMRALADIKGDFIPVNCTKLYDVTQPNPYEKLHETLDVKTSTDNALELPLPSLTPRIFDFYNISALLDNGGKTIMRHILGVVSPRSAAIFSGTQQEIAELLSQYPSLQECFPQENRLQEEPYTRDEMIHCILKEASIANLCLSPEATDKLCRLVAQAYDSGTICNWNWKDARRYVRDHLLPAYFREAISRVQQQGTEDCHLLLPADIDPRPLLERASLCDSVLKELNQMVGLKDIKQSITTHSNRMRFYTERRSLGLPTTDGVAYHAIFTGNPGTGKTTVARLLGKVYHSLGLLSRGEVISVDRSKMIGRYIGETEENMKEILRQARGNVLFVDEAYTLYNKDDERDFGRHAIEALLDVLAQKDPDMLIIFAGYEREMNQLMQINPGLFGRFPYKYRFTDYTADELTQIALNILAKDQYLLTPEAKETLEHCIREAIAQRTDTFANARWVEQLLRNGIIPALANRVSSTPHAIEPRIYQTIEADDVEQGYQQFNPRTVALNQRKAIGFCA